jgi:hypothetical protein
MQSERVCTLKCTAGSKTAQCTLLSQCMKVDAACISDIAGKTLMVHVAVACQMLLLGAWQARIAGLSCVEASPNSTCNVERVTQNTTKNGQRD